MSDKTKEEKMDIEKIIEELPENEKIFYDLLKAGRSDPVFFAEQLLDLRLHDGQKLWVWFTTRTQLDKCFEMGMKLNDEYRKLWASREEFDALLAKNVDSLKNILVPSNRWGKTLVTSVKHLWYNYYKIGVMGAPDQVAEKRCGTLNLSPHSNQCQAGYDYIMDILFSRFVYNIDGTSHKNKCKIEDFYLADSIQKRQVSFANHTFYRAVPTGEDQASSLAGTPYMYISYDECAQSLHLKEELPAKIMSRLIDFGGPLDLVSTPEVDKPSHQYFFHIAKQGMKGEDFWFTLVGRISDNIFLGEREKEKIIKTIKSTDPVKYRQVAYGEFVTTGKKMFDAVTIERLWNSYAPELPKYEHKYLLIADWGFADTGDPTVFYVLDYTEAPKYRVVFRDSIQGGSPFAVLAQAKMLQREWNGAKFLHDSGSMGGVIIRKMLQEMNMHDIIDFTSMGGQKADMLFCLLVVMSSDRKPQVDSEGKVTELNPDFGRLRSYYIPQLESQMGNYQYNPDKGVSDKRLEQDDVMALGMGIWWLERKLLKSAVKNISFNPLAPTLESIIPLKEGQKIGIRSIVIPEKIIF